MDRTLLFLAIGTVFIGYACAVDTECYDCIWYNKIDKSDDNCNTKEGLEKVDKETCDGKCYMTTTHTAFGIFVGRGCAKECVDGKTSVDEWVPGTDGDRVCCNGKNCNKEIYSGAPSVYASAITYSICLAAAFMYRKLK